MRSVIIIASLFILLESCSDNGSAAASPAADSVTVTTKTNDDKSIVSLSNETDIQKLLCQGWVMDDDVDVPSMNGEAEGPYPYRCYYLFDDFSYTKNVRNFMEYGTWSFDNGSKLINFKSSSGSKDQYKVAAVGATDMIVLNNENGSSTKLKFLGSGKRHAVNAEDPYYIDNLRWRIAPKTSESDSLIKKRLKECIHFYILFYSDNMARAEKKISFYGLPTCIRWYQGGIFMVKEKDLASNWFSCFYNKEQAMKAYNMMEKVIVKKYNWSKGRESWVKKNLDVLKQMYEKI